MHNCCKIVVGGYWQVQRHHVIHWSCIEHDIYHSGLDKIDKPPGDTVKSRGILTVTQFFLSFCLYTLSQGSKIKQSRCDGSADFQLWFKRFHKTIYLSGIRAILYRIPKKCWHHRLTSSVIDSFGLFYCYSKTDEAAFGSFLGGSINIDQGDMNLSEGGHYKAGNQQYNY